MKAVWTLFALVLCATVGTASAEAPPNAPPDHPELAILVRKIALDERIVIIQGSVLNTRVMTGSHQRKQYLAVLANTGDTVLSASVLTKGLKSIGIQNVVLADLKAVSDDGKKFEDAFGYTYELLRGPTLNKGTGPLKGSMEWKNGELEFTEPTVGLLQVIRSWKRLP